MYVRVCIGALFLLKSHLCITDERLVDKECERYDRMENYSARAFFTCIRDSGYVQTLRPPPDCRELGSDWTVTGNSKVFLCDYKYKIQDDRGSWTSGDFMEDCTDPSDTKPIVAYKSECILLTQKRQSWDNSVRVCINISASQQWRIIEYISGTKQNFLERFMLEESTYDEAWIGLRLRMNKYEWISGGSPNPFIEYINPKEGDQPAPGPSGPCYATAGAGTDRVGGGWRGRPCNTTLRVLCQKRLITTSSTLGPRTTTLQTTKPQITKSPTTKSPTTKPPTTTSTTTPTTATGQTKRSTSSGRSTNSARSIQTVSMKTEVATTIGPITKVGNDTTQTTHSNTDHTIWTYILAGVGVVVILIVCAVLIYRKKRRKPLQIPERATEAEYSTPSTNQSSTPFLDSNNLYDEAEQVHLKEKTTLYSHISNTGGAQDLTYDIANHKGTQPSATVDATYDRANFIQSESANADVYDVARLKTINSNGTEGDQSNTYDHAFIT